LLALTLPSPAKQFMQMDANFTVCNAKQFHFIYPTQTEFIGTA